MVLVIGCRLALGLYIVLWQCFVISGAVLFNGIYHLTQQRFYRGYFLLIRETWMRAEAHIKFFYFRIIHVVNVQAAFFFFCYRGAIGFGGYLVVEKRFVTEHYFFVFCDDGICL